LEIKAMSEQDHKMTDLFEKFWEVYPSKKAKATAKKSFAKYSQEEQESIIAHVEIRARLDDQWQRGFIPMPATFLNQERHLDEYTSTTHAELKDSSKVAKRPDICPGCRSYQTTQRHQDICGRGVPYFDVKVGGKLMVFRDGGLHEAGM
jgi:hypothetical protein